MIHDGVVLGLPLVNYTDTKSNIESLTISEGATAYASDTDEYGFYDGTNWQWFNPNYWHNIEMSGRLYGGTISDNGDGTVTITAGAGLVKEDDAASEGVPTALNQGQGSKLSLVTWAEDDDVTLTDEAYNYIYYDYETGNILSTTNFYSISFTQEFTLGRVYRDGTTVTIRLCGTNLWNFNRRVQLFGEEVFPVLKSDGLTVGETGERYLTVTAGVLWAELVNRFSIDAMDTSDSDTFTSWYRDGGGGWTSVASETQIDNQNYDDGTGTLEPLTNNRYGVHWVYMVHDNTLHVVYGQDNYLEASALDATVPTTIPGLLDAYATLIAKIIVEEDGTNLYSIEAPIEAVFSSSGVSDHAALSNLIWENSAHTGTVSNLAGFDGSGDADDISLGNGLALSASELAIDVTDNFTWTGTHTFSNNVNIDDSFDVDGSFDLTNIDGAAYARIWSNADVLILESVLGAPTTARITLDGQDGPTIDMVGDVSIDGDIVGDITNVDGRLLLETGGGTGSPHSVIDYPFYITRLGNTNESIRISVGDAYTLFETFQDENSAAGFGSIYWSLGNQASQLPVFIIGDGRSGTPTSVFTFDIEEDDFYSDEWQSYTPGTVVGWSSTTEENYYYKRIGKLVFVSFYVDGTSDSVNTNFSLPYQAGSNSRTRTIIQAKDNGTTSYGRAVIGNSGLVISCSYEFQALNAWTSSGTKLVYGQIIYEAA